MVNLEKLVLGDPHDHSPVGFKDGAPPMHVDMPLYVSAKHVSVRSQREPQLTLIGGKVSWLWHYLLCDFGQVTSLLCIVFASTK